MGTVNDFVPSNAPTHLQRNEQGKEMQASQKQQTDHQLFCTFTAQLTQGKGTKEIGEVGCQKQRAM